MQPSGLLCRRRAAGRDTDELRRRSLQRIDRRISSRCAAPIKARGEKPGRGHSRKRVRLSVNAGKKLLRPCPWPPAGRPASWPGSPCARTTQRLDSPLLGRSNSKGRATKRILYRLVRTSSCGDMRFTVHPVAHATVLGEARPVASRRRCRAYLETSTTTC